MNKLSERNDVVRALLLTLDHHTPGELDHAERVAVYSVATGQKLGLSEDELLTLRYGATLHDIGKVRIDRALLSRPGGLTEGELAVVRLHAELALSVVEGLEFLSRCVPILRHHHERFDGKGYPEGLAGEQIPLGARIVGLAEAFDIMTLGAPWRAPMEETDAFEELADCSGTHFDPKVLAAFNSVRPLIQPVGS